MHILISGTTYAPSLNGQAIFTVNLAEGLAARGHDVTMVFPSDQHGPYTNTRNGVRLEHVRSVRLSWIHPNVRVPSPYTWEINRIFDTARPEIVHIQDHYPPSGMMLRQAKRRGICVVGSNHFMPENLAPYIPGLRAIQPVFNWLLWKWMLQTYNQADLIT